MTYEYLLNHGELFAYLYQGNLAEAYTFFKNRCDELGSLSLKQIRIFLTSINHGIYHHIIHQENIFLYQCCYENDMLIQECTYQNYLEVGKEIIFSYGQCTAYLIEKHQNEHIKKAVSYIHNHLSEPLTLPIICNAISLNECYFCNLFRKEVGMTFREYVLNQRIALAKKLLRQTDLPLSMVAAKCGFQQISYFCTSFKKVEGMTPLQYAKQTLA